MPTLRRSHPPLSNTGSDPPQLVSRESFVRFAWRLCETASEKNQLPEAEDEMRPRGNVECIMFEVQCPRTGMRGDQGQERSTAGEQEVSSLGHPLGCAHVPVSKHTGLAKSVAHVQAALESAYRSGSRKSHDAEGSDELHEESAPYEVSLEAGVAGGGGGTAEALSQM